MKRNYWLSLLDSSKMVKVCQPKDKCKHAKEIPLLSLPVSRQKNIARRSRCLSFTGTVPKIAKRKTCLSILANSRRKVIPVCPKIKAIRGKPVQSGMVNHGKPIFVTIKYSALENKPIDLTNLLDSLKIGNPPDPKAPIPIRKQDTMGGIPELSI